MMANADQDAALREAATHRGFRLVKSRRRKAGVGDYGKYGLADAKTGKECFGFGDGELTASVEDVAAFLRQSAASTWQQSAETTPDRPPPEPKPAPEPEPRRSKAAREPEPAEPPTPVAPEPRRSPPREAGAKRALPRKPASKPSPPPEPAPKPEPALAIRPATRTDAGPVARLLGDSGMDAEEAAITAHVADQARAKSPLLVADRGGILGCLSWHALPTPHLGTIGRITLVLVAERARRGGIGRALIDAAAEAMAAQGCTRIEAISDIEIRNVHGFFRSTGFTQTSYRLTREL